MAPSKDKETGSNKDDPQAESKGRFNIGNVLVILVVLGFFAENLGLAWYYRPWADGMPEPAAVQALRAEQASAEDKGEEETPAGPASVLQLDPFIVNLIGEEERSYAKATFYLGLGEASAADAIAENPALLAPMRQTVIEVLGDQHPAKVVSAEGKTSMREEIMTRLNELPLPTKVTDVYITEFLVQF